MNFIKNNLALLVIILIGIFSVFEFYQVGRLKQQIANSKIQNLDQDSKGKQAKIDYIQREIPRLEKSRDSIAALRIQDSLVLKEKDKFIAKLLKKKYENYTVNRSLNIDEVDSAFTREGFTPYAISGSH